MNIGWFSVIQSNFHIKPVGSPLRSHRVPPGYYKLLRIGFIDHIVLSPLFFFSFVLCDWFANIFSPWMLKKDTHCAVRLSPIRFCPRVVGVGEEDWLLLISQ